MTGASIRAAVGGQSWTRCPDATPPRDEILPQFCRRPTLFRDKSCRRASLALALATPASTFPALRERLSMQSNLFGRMPDGTAVHSFSLRGSAGLTATITQ